MYQSCVHLEDNTVGVRAAPLEHAAHQMLQLLHGYHRQADTGDTEVTTGS